MALLCICSLGYFRFYVILGFFIIISGSVIGIFLPLWEARHLFFKVTKVKACHTSPLIAPQRVARASQGAVTLLDLERMSFLPLPQALLVSIHSFITRFTIYRSGALQQIVLGSNLACPVLRYFTMCMKASGLEKSRAECIPLSLAGHHRPHIPRMEGQELPWRQRS